MNLKVWQILGIVVLVPIAANFIVFIMAYRGYLPKSSVDQTTRAVAAAETIMAALSGAHAYAGFWQSRTTPPDIHLWVTGFAGWLVGGLILLTTVVYTRSTSSSDGISGRDPDTESDRE